MDDDQVPGGHPAIYSKKPKTSMRRAKQAKPAGGIQHLQSAFLTPDTQEAHSDLDLAAASSLPEELPPATDMAFDTNVGDDKPEVTEESTVKQPVDKNLGAPLRQYSNEARVYHCRYAALSEAHDLGQYNICREGSLDLLTEPNLPLYTRVQVLQMVSTLMHPLRAESFLDDAAHLLANMDSTLYPVQLLTHDNEMMQADLQTWRSKKGLIGKDLEAIEAEGLDAEDDDEPTAAWWDLDRAIQGKLDQELAEELDYMKLFPEAAADGAEREGQVAKDEEMRSAPGATAHDQMPSGLPSPGGSDEEL
ncbi:hypothetical protein TI39_contig274g00004 [Zymoseptoria brevis]|uniref:Uncharacterized protein n=1 Tax=Zymoseptoria brevis TaxID=1047168 RepID=A0A0F4H087_9PEZI|nr:hypothetical protein TI39_contig274g00004 [Zymoseptoria brevis]